MFLGSPPRKEAKAGGQQQPVQEYRKHRLAAGPFPSQHKIQLVQHSRGQPPRPGPLRGHRKPSGFDPYYLQNETPRWNDKQLQHRESISERQTHEPLLHGEWESAWQGLQRARMCLDG